MIKYYLSILVINNIQNNIVVISIQLIILLQNQKEIEKNRIRKFR